MSAPENTCPKCGAPAEPFAPEITTITCHFCGVPYPVRHPDFERFRREKENREREAREAEKKKHKERERSKGSAAGCAVPFVVVGFLAVTFGGTYWYEDVYKPRQWDGHHDFSCKSGDITFTDLQATGDVDARGTCTLRFVRPQFESHIRAREHATVYVTGGRIHDNSGTVVSAEGFAKVVIDGASIDGDEAIRAKGSATVETKNNTTIRGKVRADSPTEIIGYTPPAASSAPSGASTAPPATATAASPPRDLTRFPCQGVVECFQSWDGKFSGKLTVTIDKDGYVKRTSISGTQTPTIKACLSNLGAKKELSITAGATPPGAGDLVCTYSGTRSGFITQVSTSGSFVPAQK